MALDARPRILARLTIMAILAVILGSHIDAHPAECLVPLSFPQGLDDEEDIDAGAISVTPLSDGHLLFALTSNLLDLAPGTTSLRRVNDSRDWGYILNVWPASDGRVIASTTKGLFLYESGGQKAEQITNFAPIGTVSATLLLDDSRILVGSETGLYSVTFEDEHHARVSKVGKMHDAVTALLQDGKDSAIVATKAGLYKFSAESVELKTLQASDEVTEIDVMPYGWYRFIIGGVYFVLPPGAVGLIRIGQSNTTRDWSVSGKDRAFFKVGNLFLMLTRSSSDVVDIDGEFALDDSYPNFTVDSDDSILFATSKGLFEIPAQKPAVITLMPFSEPGKGLRLTPIADGRYLITVSPYFESTAGYANPQKKGRTYVTSPGMYRWGMDAVKPAMSGFGPYPYLDQSSDSAQTRAVQSSDLFWLFDHLTHKLVKLSDSAKLDTYSLPLPLSDGRTILTGSDGFYILGRNETAVRPLQIGTKTERLGAIATKDGRAILSIGAQLYLVTPGIAAAEPVQYGGADKLPIPSVITSGAKVGTLIISDHGVYRLAPGARQIVALADSLQGTRLDAAGFYDFAGTSVIAAQKYLALLGTDDLRDAKVEFQPKSLFPVNETAIINATVKSGVCETSVGIWSPKLRVWPASGEKIKDQTLDAREKDGSQFTFAYTFPSAGLYTVQLEVQGVPVGARTEIRVGNVWDTFGIWLKYGLAALTIVDLIAVTILTIGARYWDTCFRVLFDPVWGKVAFYFNALLRHCRPLQRWILRRYVTNASLALRGSIEEPYEPLPLCDNGGNITIADSTLLNVIDQYPCLWIQGNAGMGKSAIVRMLERAYFDSMSKPDLRASRRTKAMRRAVFLFIPARRYESLTIEPDAPESWLIKAVALHLAHYGLRFPDPLTVRAMLTSGTLALVVDGVNEVGKDEQIAAFALLFPAATIMVTSQSEMREPFHALRLPSDVKDFIEKFLRAHMGEIGARLAQCIRHELPDLLLHIRSGYDLRLVVDLVRQHAGTVPLSMDMPDVDNVVLDLVKQLPSTRIGLYEAMLSAAGEQYPIRELELVAWKMWLSGQRELPVDEKAQYRLVRPLEEKRVQIVRRVSGAIFEFRHDQMRAFLAARWLMGQTANFDMLAMHLSPPEVWTVDARDQAELWPFVAACLPVSLMPSLWNFSVVTKERQHLQHALQDEALARGIKLYEEVSLIVQL